jgi:hypothetical protein
VAGAVIIHLGVVLAIDLLSASVTYMSHGTVFMYAIS